MNISPYVTVVMAVYNAEKSLNESISSVLSQTFSNWLMICVDDGSTDSSLMILEKFASQDKRIIVVSKKNGGPASARAVAFEMLTTPYAIILDSDDAYTPNLLEVCVKKAILNDADSVAPNFLIELSDNYLMDWNKSYGWSDDDILTGIEAFKRTFISATMHGVNMWKSSLLKIYATGDNANYNHFNEDEYIQRLLFLNCKKVVFATECAYLYKRNLNSITKKFSIKQLKYIITCEKLQKLCCDYCIGAEISSIVNEYYFRVLTQLKIRIYKNKKYISKQEYDSASCYLKEKYYQIIRYKRDFRFVEKRYPWLYRFFSIHSYFLFDLSTYILSKK